RRPSGSAGTAPARGLSREDPTGVCRPLSRAGGRAGAVPADPEGRRVSVPPADDHYSYRVYADPATAQHFDERRFGGDIGRMVAASQADALARFAGQVADRTVLDVGTGTGRAALLMARAGARVTGVDPSEEMLAIARA